MTESEKEKKIFLSYCGSRDQELLTGRKKMTLGDMERFSFLTEFFGLESYGLNLWKEFGDDVEEPLDALIKLLDEWEYENDTWIDDDGRLERWLVEFRKRRNEHGNSKNNSSTGIRGIIPEIKKQSSEKKA